MRGDFDGDGRWTARDAEAALQMSVNMRQVDLNLDVDDDGQVLSSDARIILQGTARKQKRDDPARKVIASTPPPQQPHRATKPVVTPSPPPVPKVTAPLNDPPATVAARTEIKETKPLMDPAPAIAPPPRKPAAPPSSGPFYATCLMYEAQNFDQLTGQSANARLKLPQVKDRLRSVNVSQIQWKAADQPVLLHATAGALGRYSAESFKPGQRLCGPAQLAVTGKTPVSMTGAVLLECREVFRSRSEVLAKYPGALVDGLPPGGSIESAQGKMVAMPASGAEGVFQIAVLSDQTGAMTLKFGPLQQGWSDEAMRQSLELTAQFKAFCAGEMAWLGVERDAQLLALRRFRDEVLASSAGGREFIRFYYDDFSPWAKRAMIERPDTLPVFRAAFDIAATLVNHDSSGAPRVAAASQRAESSSTANRLTKP
jgi:hypothetical protein